MKKCDIIIPVWNELESTKECINSLLKFTKYPYRLIVIDNGSREPTRTYLDGIKKIFPDFLLIRNDINLGFVKAVNQGVSASNDPYICLLNNDALVTEGWLNSLVETVETALENIGIANPASNVFGKASPYGKGGERQELDSCKGFCMFIKREVVEKIGLFDEIYRMGYFEEKDFSRRAREAGYICVMAKTSFVYHKDRLSFDKMNGRDELFKGNEAIYNRKWGRSLSVAFLEKEENGISDKKDLIYRLLNKGHRVNIFFVPRLRSGRTLSSVEGFAKNKFSSSLKDHIQIKYFPISPLFFEPVVLFKLWERRKKKRLDVLVIDDANATRFFNRFRLFHGADVLHDENEGVLNFCESKSKGEINPALPKEENANRRKSWVNN